MQLPIVCSRSIFAIAILTFAVATLSSASQANAQTTWYVDDNAPNDPGPGDLTVSDPNEDGSPAHPFDAIQEAIDISTNGDEVVVEDGTYTGSGNRDLDFGGRAITVRSASGDSTSCIIDCESQGRGFYFHSSERPDSIVHGLTVMNGEHSYSGAGINCSGSSPTIANCLITGSYSDWKGGAVCCYASDLLIQNCKIVGNTARGEGGGIWCRYGEPRIINCVITENMAESGGGICNYQCDPRIINCTIAANIARLHGGGVLCEQSDPILYNCILWGDASEEIYVDSGSPVVRYCCVQGGWSGSGNIDAAPFIIPRDFHLAQESPCIDTGTNGPWSGLPADDLDGVARPLDGNADSVAVADMGAYEFDPTTPLMAIDPTEFVFFAREGGDLPAGQILALANCGGGMLSWQVVGEPTWLTASPSAGESNGEVDESVLSVDATGLPRGKYEATLEVLASGAVVSARDVHITLYVCGIFHVPTDFTEIQTAIDATIPGDEIVLADGIYTGAGNKDLDFRGKPITLRSTSGDPGLCIIDCQGEGRGFYFQNGEGPDSVVKGLTVTNGYVENYVTDGNHGGGVLCIGSSPSFVNCTISSNTAAGQYGSGGGGVYCSDGSPTFMGCLISDNSSTGDEGGGGGFYGLQSNPTFVNSTITGNSVTGLYAGGGGVCFGLVSAGVFTNCMIVENSSAKYGGGVDCHYYSSPVFANCSISGNSSTLSGGAVYCASRSDPTLANCTITGNRSADGAIYCKSNSNPMLINSILWGNIPQAMFVNSGDPVATYCNIRNGFGEPWFGTGCIDTNPRFASTDSLRLTSNSPCIDAGSNRAVPADTTDLDNNGDIAELLPFDLDGQPRFIDDPQTTDTGIPMLPDYPAIVDMGAYECQPPLPGDLDHDGDIDLEDFFTWQPCLTGPTTPADTNCQAMDIDNDGDVDLNDFARFQRLFTGGT